MAERVTHVGSYRIERELARDERHVVYQGWQTSLNRPVQITQLLPEAADPDFVGRWKLVARDLRDPGHPQLPRILDAQFGGEQPYLVETYLIADTLADRRGRPQELGALTRQFAGLAGALAYAHKRGWAHGHLAADQVRVADDDTAYVVDLPWQAAQRPKGDAAAMQADTQALAQILCWLREPAAGPAPELSGWPGEDEQALAGWLAQGEPAESAELARAAAPVLAWALSGTFATCEELADALRPLLPAVQAAAPTTAAPAGNTIVTPPPGAVVQAAAASPASPPPAVYPAPQPQAYPTPQPQVYAPAPAAYSSRSGSRRGLGALLAGLILVAALAIGGVLLCRTGVLPFCTSCNDGLIVQYVSGATGYVERQAWDEAQRELALAQTECATCSTQPAACAEIAALTTQAACAGGVEQSIAEGKTLLENGDTCQAVARLETVAAQAETCGVDGSLAQSFLARNSDGGAYALCAQDRLAAAEVETAAEPRAALCAEARTLLGKAHELKPAAAKIGEPYTQAERYAAFRQSYDARAWDAADEALGELELVATSGRYCGMPLSDFRFEIMLAQAGQAWQGQPCQAWETLKAAQTYARSLEQQGRLDEASAASEAACRDTWTPTPEPTATPTPTPKPELSVTQDEVTLRSGPGKNYKALDQKAKKGDTFKALCWSDAQDGSGGRWTKVALPSGQEAWLAADLATISGEPMRCTSVPPTATPVPVCYGWKSKVLATDQITKPLIEIRAIARDQNNQPVRGLRVHVWAYNTEFRADTGPNGEYVWAGISQPIGWNVCVYNKVACQVAPFTDNGQRVNIEFRRAQVPCK